MSSVLASASERAIRWADLRDDGLELVVEQTAQGRMLALHGLNGVVPVVARKLGFQPASADRYVRSDLAISLDELRRVFPGVKACEVDAGQVLRDADPLRSLREQMRRYYGPDVSVERYELAEPDAATRIRARAMSRLLGIEPVFLRYTGIDPRLDFAGVALRRDGDRRTYVNVDAPYPLMGVLGHESLHIMRRDQPQLYGELVAALRPLVDEPAFARYARRLDATNRKIDGRGMSEDQIREEAVADIVGDMLLDPRIWDRIEDRDLVTRLLEWLREIFAKIADTLRGRRPAVEGCLGGLDLLHNVEAARDVVADALAAWRDAQRPQRASGDAIEMAWRLIEPTGQSAAPELAHSRIRNPDGSLKVVYRGEWGPLADHPFDATKCPTPPFSASPDVASVYAASGSWGDGPARVGAYHLDIRNPMQVGTLDEDVVELGALCDALTATGKVSAAEVRAAFATLERIRHYPPEELAKPVQEQEPCDFCNGPADALSEFDYTDTYVVADSPVFVELARRAGFDGMVLLGTFTSADRFHRPMEEAIAAGYDHDLSAALEFRAFDRAQVRPIFDCSFEPAFAGVAFKRVWHGSPFRFERPSLAHAQERGVNRGSYGWGVYLSEAREVGAYYRDVGASALQPFRVGDRWAPLRDVAGVAEAAIGPGTGPAAASIARQLAEGRLPAALQREAEQAPEPRRSVWLSVLPDIECLIVSRHRPSIAMLAHRDGAMALGGDRAMGRDRAERMISCAIAAGEPAETARARVLAEERARLPMLEVRLRQAREAQAATGSGAALDGLREQDAAAALRESQAVVDLLDDPRTLAFDTRVMTLAGQLYVTDLDEGAVLLDWDAPIGEQPAVEKAFSPATAKALVKAWEDATGERWDGNFWRQSGAQLYGALEDVHGGAQAAAQALSALGFKGLQYRDVDPRYVQPGQGVCNFVVWDLAALHEFRPESESNEAVPAF